MLSLYALCLPLTRFDHFRTLARNISHAAAAVLRGFNPLVIKVSCRLRVYLVHGNPREITTNYWIWWNGFIQSGPDFRKKNGHFEKSIFVPISPCLLIICSSNCLSPRVASFIDSGDGYVHNYDKTSLFTGHLSLRSSGATGSRRVEWTVAGRWRIVQLRWW